MISKRSSSGGCTVFSTALISIILALGQCPSQIGHASCSRSPETWQIAHRAESSSSRTEWSSRWSSQSFATRGISEASHSRASGVQSGTHEASQNVVEAWLGGLAGIGSDGVGMYLGIREAWALGLLLWLDALASGKLGSNIGLDAGDAWN